MAYIEDLFSDHFIQYASYVIRDRAIPSLSDGLKPVQRRILQSLWDMDDGKFHKVANVVGHCMQYHPHGDASIYGALVHLANKELFIEKQGNFGNIYTGDPASAARYIECRLSPLARRSLFHPEITEFLPSYDGRRNEPIGFPAKLPFLLILGAEGIAVGMSTRILPHNLGEVISAMCAHLRGESFVLLPDFPTGGLLDVSQYNQGNGRVLSRARLECRESQIVIRELPCGVTTESLIASLETACRKGQLRVQNIQDFTAEEVEIVLQLPRGVSAQEQLEALYAFSYCEVSISCKLLAIDERRPVELDTAAVLRDSCRRLLDILRAELELEARRLQQQIFSRRLERIFIEERLYQKLEGLTRLKEIEASILAGLEPYCAAGAELGRPVSKDELATLLRLPIRRISGYDIARMQKELRELEKNLRQVERHLRNLTKYALAWLEGLQRDFAAPRQSELSRFAKVEARQAAQRDQILRYEAAEGFLGYGLKTGLELFACSPYDRILVLRRSGTYRVLAVPEKLFVGQDMLFCHLAGKDELAQLEAAVLLRAEPSGYSYAKRIRFGAYILGKEYRIIPEKTALQYFVAISAEQQQASADPRKPVSPLLAQPATDAAALAVSFPAQRGETVWHYRLCDLPAKALKAKGQLLRRQKVGSIELIGQKKLEQRLAGPKEILDPDFLKKNRQ